MHAIFFHIFIVTNLFLQMLFWRPMWQIPVYLGCYMHVPCGVHQEDGTRSQQLTIDWDNERDVAKAKGKKKKKKCPVYQSTNQASHLQSSTVWTLEDAENVWKSQDRYSVITAQIRLSWLWIIGNNTHTHTHTSAHLYIFTCVTIALSVFGNFPPLHPCKQASISLSSLYNQ